MIAEGVKNGGMPDSSRLARGEATHIRSKRVVVKEKVSCRSLARGYDLHSNMAWMMIKVEAAHN